jgi:sulfatase modifying factor 1
MANARRVLVVLLVSSLSLSVATASCGGDVFQSSSPEGGAPDSGAGFAPPDEEQDATVTPVDSGADAPPPFVCPKTTRGPEMVPVVRAGAAPFCIDVTEVTKAQYKLFLDAVTGGQAITQPAECAWNATFLPQYDWPPLDRADHPINNIDWCDARAYCAWAGKRLCGSPAGGPSTSSTGAGNESAWFLACSGSAGTAFPYSTKFVAGACNDCTAQGTCGQVVYNMTVPVKSKPVCVDPAGIYDMSGNVEEWEDLCAAAGGAGSEDDVCLARGGGWPNKLAPELSCTANSRRQRNAILGEVGVRCCSK